MADPQPRPLPLRAVDAILRTLPKIPVPSPDELHEEMRDAQARFPEMHPLDVIRKRASRDVHLMMMMIHTMDESRAAAEAAKAAQPEQPVIVVTVDPPTPHTSG